VDNVELYIKYALYGNFYCNINTSHLQEGNIITDICVFWTDALMKKSRNVFFTYGSHSSNTLGLNFFENLVFMNTKFGAKFKLWSLRIYFFTGSRTWRVRWKFEFEAIRV